ncbi:putative receptor-like protein kinase At4g00960 isoform X2 [Ipomoea triloba]|uniref:putative receptor-like protein kinase At4g00960 isoform X2 n=1 Tax=Ipomoea triloba TaxID=35885 RepID=UPI00125E08F5|nr:putative receptor-like protein kinase At4g00960 isoform X2 [Ipomoea triloba]
MDLQKWLAFLYLCSMMTLLAIAQPDLRYCDCVQSGNYTENSTYQRNLNTLLASLPSKLDEYGFCNASMGETPDRVSVVGLCRGDVEPDICQSCIKNAARETVQLCPNQKEVFGGYDECLIHYSNVSTVGRWSRSPWMYMWNLQNASSPDQFYRDLSKLLDGLGDRAANGFSLCKFAAGNTSGPDLQSIYAAVQCSPDLGAQDCSDCLVSTFADFPGCQPCTGKRRGRVVRPGCNFRFESYRFYNYTLIGSTPPQSQSQPQPGTPAPKSAIEAPSSLKSGKNDNKVRIIIIIVVPIVAIIIIVLSLCVCIVRKKKQKRKQENNMDDSNKLGQGGFGPVYKGKLPNGLQLAVKRLSVNSRQGDQEFKNEVLLVAKLEHRNLVRLLGFCLEGREKLLVYEFAPNASLDHFLFDPVKRENLDWETRYKIIGGISRGLLYLHEESRLRIIHRDLKASNVLLDANMNPKISDFGMAKLFELDESEGNTSRIVGTYGYMSPEYAMHGQFSVKSDVFSFGVLVLEIVSGQKNSCFKNGESVKDLLSYAWTQWREGTAMNLVDPFLKGKSGSVPEMMRCIHLALLCVQENVADRPTMSTVVLMLSGFSMSLPVPSAPPFFMHSTISNEVLLLPETAAYSSQNEASITELYPR